MNKLQALSFFLFLFPVVFSAQSSQLTFENEEFIYEGLRYEILDFHKVVMLDNKERQILSKMQEIESNKIFMKIGTVLSVGLLSFYPAFVILEDFTFQLHPAAYYIFPVGFFTGVVTGIVTIIHRTIYKIKMKNLSARFVYHFNNNPIPRSRI